MPRVLRMPEVSADSGDGVLAAWLVEETARFDAAQTIAYVETDDELFSVEAGRPGLLLKTLVEPGTRVAPGTPIGVLGEPWEQVGDVEPVQLLDVADPVQAGPEAGVVQHHYLRARVRVDRLVALAGQRELSESTVTDLVVRAVAAAHRQVPQLAVARLDDDRSATPGVPVSDPGRFGVEEAAPVVPPGHSAALAVGAVLDEPVVDGGAIVPGKVMTLTLSVEPGRVDDVHASRWLAVLVALLERPEWLLD